MPIPCATKTSCNINTHNFIATGTSLNQSSCKDNTIETSTSDEVFDVIAVLERRAFNSRIFIVHSRVLTKGFETLRTNIDILNNARLFEAFVPLLRVFVEQCFANIFHVMR
jgi:hypothetical protein